MDGYSRCVKMIRSIHYKNINFDPEKREPIKRLIERWFDSAERKVSV